MGLRLSNTSNYSLWGKIPPVLTAVRLWFVFFFSSPEEKDDKAEPKDEKGKLTYLLPLVFDVQRIYAHSSVASA